MESEKGNKSGIYSRNRSKLVTRIQEHGVVVLFSSDYYVRSGDQFFPYRQNADMLYLTGIEQKECTLILAPQQQNSAYREMLFIPYFSEIERIYDGDCLTKEQASAISEIATVYYQSEFERVLREVMGEGASVYLLQNEYPKLNAPVAEGNERQGSILQKRYNIHEYRRLAPITTALRMVKEPEEVALIAHACAITKSAFSAILKAVKPGMGEYEVEAIMSYYFRKEQGQGHAFAPICASGGDACTLHYIQNRKVMEEGTLLLMDFGAEYRNYAADCSRTIPVNGVFTPRQRACYNAVLRVMKGAEKLFVPGNTVATVNDYVIKEMSKEMVALGLFSAEELANQDPKSPICRCYLPHGVSHHLGLDVHDVSTKDAVFEAGMVLTLEPGIYIREENIGIRIEDDIVVGITPQNLTKDIPKEVEDIERLMNR